jgi:hypothetical protein
MLDALTPLGPGEGAQWERLAEWLRSRLPVANVDGIWVLRTLRRDPREYGTAIISLVQDDRRQIYTSSYVATIKGKSRGGFESSLTEVGSGPLEALHELLALVPVRSDDEDPPTPVAVALWFPAQEAVNSPAGEADEAGSVAATATDPGDA